MDASTPPPRFAADAMLGRLARWLRVLGFDTSYDPALTDADLVRLADEQGRILLTRDRHLLRELHPALAHEVRQDGSANAAQGSWPATKRKLCGRMFMAHRRTTQRLSLISHS